MSHTKSPLPLACAARYVHQKELASGGYGTVHLALQKGLERLVVVKLLHAQTLDDPDAVARFQNEARIAATISSPHVAQLVEAGFDGVPYIVYEYLPGHSVRALLDAGPLTPALAVRIARDTLAGLAAAHALGILHRDIKPENVLQGDGENFKVTDFGIAKWTRDGAVRTKTGFVLGTPTYLAPEVIRGTGLDARADLYSTGVMLHELLTGAPPFTDTNPILLLERHLTVPPPPLPAALADAEPALARVLERALAKDPDARWRTAEEMSAALGQLACVASPAPIPVARVRGGASGAPRGVSRTVVAPAPGPTHSGRFRRRAAFAGVLGALLVGSGLIWAALRPAPTLPASPAPRPPGANAAGAEELLARVAALDAALPPVPEDDPSLTRRARREAAHADGKSRRYEGARETALAALVADVDRLLPAIAAHDDLENVVLPFMWAAYQVAKHAAHLKRQKQDFPQPGARPLDVSRAAWIAPLFEVARAEADIDENPVKSLVAKARAAVPPLEFGRAADARSLAVVEHLLNLELWFRGDKYLDVLNGDLASGIAPETARQTAELAIAVCAWHQRNPGMPTQLEAKVWPLVARLLVVGPWTTPRLLSERLRAFEALRGWTVAQRDVRLGDQQVLADVGRLLIPQEARAAPSFAPSFAALPGVPDDWTGPFLEAVRAARGHPFAARAMLFRARPMLEGKIAEPVEGKPAKALPKKAYQCARYLLDVLQETHAGTVALLGAESDHSGCAAILALDLRWLPADDRKARAEHDDIEGQMHPR